MTLSVCGTSSSPTPVDDSVTVTHFSLDSWGKMQQKTTPFTPKVANKSQNPFTSNNPFTNNTSIEEPVLNNNSNNHVEVIIKEEPKPVTAPIVVAEEKKVNTNPFIDSNPFLQLGLNPFATDLSPTLTPIPASTPTPTLTPTPTTSPIPTPTPKTPVIEDAPPVPVNSEDKTDNVGCVNGTRVIKTEEIQTTTTTLTHKVRYPACANILIIVLFFFHRCTFFAIVNLYFIVSSFHQTNKKISLKKNSTCIFLKK